MGNKNRVNGNFGKFDDAKFQEFIREGHKDGRDNTNISLDIEYELAALYESISEKALNDVNHIIAEGIERINTSINSYISRIAARNADRLNTTKRTLQENLTIDYIEQVKPNLPMIVSESLNGFNDIKKRRR